MTRRLAPSLALLALAACQNPSYTNPAGVREASAAEVASCRYVTDVRMQPGVWGPWFEDRAIENARQKILLDARDAGANSVVFDSSAGAGALYITAKAYHC